MHNLTLFRQRFNCWNATKVEIQQGNTSVYLHNVSLRVDGKSLWVYSNDTSVQLLARVPLLHLYHPDGIIVGTRELTIPVKPTMYEQLHDTANELQSITTGSIQFRKAIIATVEAIRQLAKFY